jgi:hypothetical protein
MRNTYKVLIRGADEKGPLGRDRHRWEDNIHMDLSNKIGDMNNMPLGLTSFPYFSTSYN